MSIALLVLVVLAVLAVVLGVTAAAVLVAAATAVDGILVRGGVVVVTIDGVVPAVLFVFLILRVLPILLALLVGDAGPLVPVVCVFLLL